jgi:hypothetical protein
MTDVARVAAARALAQRYPPRTAATPPPPRTQPAPEPRELHIGRRTGRQPEPQPDPAAVVAAWRAAGWH